MDDLTEQILYSSFNSLLKNFHIKATTKHDSDKYLEYLHQPLSLGIRTYDFWMGFLTMFKMLNLKVRETTQQIVE